MTLTNFENIDGEPHVIYGGGAIAVGDLGIVLSLTPADDFNHPVALILTPGECAHLAYGAIRMLVLCGWGKLKGAFA